MGKDSTWGDVSEGGGSGASFLKVEAGQSAVVHVLGGEKGPKVFHSVYFAAINRGVIVDPNANPLAGLEDGYETRKRYAFSVVDMSDGQVKAFACGSQVANQIKGIYTEYGNLDEVDLKITRIGTGLKTKYQIIPVKKKFTEEMLEGVEIPDLDEVFAITADEAIEKMMRGEDPKGDFDPEKLDKAPAPKAGKKTAPPAEEEEPAPAEAEEETPPAAEEEDPPAAEEEETPAPKKTTAVPPAKAPDNSRAALLQAIKSNFSKLKRYANPKQQLVDIQHFGGKDKSALSQLETAILQKMLNFQKTAK
jgi:hypothetical protein